MTKKKKNPCDWNEAHFERFKSPTIIMTFVGNMQITDNYENKNIKDP